eukprot:CAMPEP_0198540984 /NCGR_PEP_ID=MMETSP1462-20131121/53506_1 /TAXON_ID=1333877 /ORGANISM="Brandtodinium nutriculum, Strain RCC3387" /LENGTH=107 /DNA_ID=CAMNT_0044271127 /DNA_START=244 /DNA_END=567 /DNA_ORIENTATION=-
MPLLAVGVVLALAFGCLLWRGASCAPCCVYTVATFGLLYGIGMLIWTIRVAVGLTDAGRWDGAGLAWFAAFLIAGLGMLALSSTLIDRTRRQTTDKTAGANMVGSDD